MRPPGWSVELIFGFCQNRQRRGIRGNPRKSLRTQPRRREIGRIELGWGRSHTMQNHSIQPLRPLRRRRILRGIGQPCQGAAVCQAPVMGSCCWAGEDVKWIRSSAN